MFLMHLSMSNSRPKGNDSESVCSCVQLGLSQILVTPHQTSTLDHPFLFSFYNPPASEFCPSGSRESVSMTFSLVENVIYAVLTATEKIGQFHWMIVVAQSPTFGFQFHATNKFGTQWHYECVPWDLSYSSSSSCSSCSSWETDSEHSFLDNAVSFTPIGTMSVFGESLDASHLHEYLKDIPIPHVSTADSLYDERMSSLWWRQAIRVLHQSGLFVRCANLDAFEGEIKRKSTAAEYASFVHPLPRVLSTKLAGPWPDS
ncbi:hypothetical protein D9758_002727 [Tetrapyrgos nigripes]|uniref:Uncharacterized protein n=1 Tax=Tetrapyrgos nigripes TaxID=182062 RepID=A0A8H5GQQ4_9AGAR|nr:hypothetical protein D9758_002727 [Tetrapyrgos nigripes]